MVGAVAGTPGTNPTGWFLTASANSISPEIVGTGVEDGITYVDIRYSGISTGAGSVSILASLVTAITAATGQSWTGSAYVKLQAGSLSNVTNTLQSVNGRSSIGAGLESTNATYTPTSDSLGVQRRTVSITLANASTERISHTIFNAAYASGAAIDITLRIGLPQLEQGAFATSVIPTTTATVTRAADVASITGSNFGVTRTNLLVRSEEFDDAAWTKGNSSITANTIVAPDGTLTADKLVEDTSSATHYARRSTSPTINTNPITFSVYVKAAERIYVGLAIQEATTFTRQSNVNFNLGSGTANTVSSIGGAGSASATIIPVGNGWYRCTLTTTLGGTDTNALSWIYVSTSSGFNYTGDGTSGIYIWGAQLEVGSAVTPYIQSPSVFTSRASSGTYVGGNGLIQTATTNEARYDHNPVSLISKGLLLEDARTNLALDSEDFSAATWTLNAVTVTANAAVSPTGATTADSLLETTANTEHILYATATYTFTTATQSIYVKPNGRTNVALRFYYGINDWVARVFSLTGSGSVTQSSAGSSSGFSAVSSSIVDAGNGWYRISMTATQASRLVYVSSPDLCTSSTPTLAASNGSEVYAGDVTKGVYVWGAQLETASTASSYIPTTGSTVTRAADISTSVATSVFESSFYNQTEGTVFTDCSITYTVPGSLFPLVSSLNDGTSNNRIENGFLTSTLAGYEVVASGSAQVGVYPSAVSVLARRLATNYQLNNFAACVNGKSISTDTTGIVPTVSQLRIGDRAGGASTNVLNGTIKRLTYWPTRLGNEVLQRITQ
jgi:hypothetical protein